MFKNFFLCLMLFFVLVVGFQLMILGQLLWKPWKNLIDINSGSFCLPLLKTCLISCFFLVAVGSEGSLNLLAEEIYLFNRLFIFPGVQLIKRLGVLASWLILDGERIRTSKNVTLLGEHNSEVFSVSVTWTFWVQSLHAHSDHAAFNYNGGQAKPRTILSFVKKHLERKHL